MEWEHFELRRKIDDLVYKFSRKLRSDGKIGYIRFDMDVWIIYDNEYGWIAYDEETKSVTGRPWNVLIQNQNKDHPPEDEWVSKKGAKSYVYELFYTK